MNSKTKLVPPTRNPITRDQATTSKTSFFSLSNSDGGTKPNNPPSPLPRRSGQVDLYDGGGGAAKLTRCETGADNGKQNLRDQILVIFQPSLSLVEMETLLSPTSTFPFNAEPSKKKPRTTYHISLNTLLRLPLTLPSSATIKSHFSSSSTTTGSNFSSSSTFSSRPLSTSLNRTKHQRGREGETIFCLRSGSDMARAVQMDGLTSGASSRIIPVLRVLRNFILRIQAFLIWILFLRFTRRSARAYSAALEEEEPARKVAKRREEDVLTRRALAQSFCDGDDMLFLGSRNKLLFTRSWIPDSASNSSIKGLLVILHGLNEHSGRYEYFARQLNSRGFGVYAMDWIGHGGSDGLHGYVPSLDHVVADTKAFLSKINLDHPGVPCFLFGHSTGGAVVLKSSLLTEVQTMVEAVILTSPAIRVKPAHPIFGALAPIFSFLLPTFQFGAANRRGIPVSRDPAALAAKYSDPLVYTGPIRVRTGHEILRISAYLQRNLEKVTIPFLVLHGTADRVTDPSASQELYTMAASECKDIRLYEGFLHDLLFEPERDDVADDIIKWMEYRLKC